MPPHMLTTVVYASRDYQKFSDIGQSQYLKGNDLTNYNTEIKNALFWGEVIDIQTVIAFLIIIISDCVLILSGRKFSLYAGLIHI